MCAALAEWTVFLHGKLPTCGFFLVDPHRMGNHLLTNVSVLDYLLGEHAVRGYRASRSASCAARRSK